MNENDDKKGVHLHTNQPIMQFFEYSHLPEKLKEVSLPFWQVAHTMNTILPHNPEKTTALRKLLEAKDCAVRAYIFKQG